MFEDLFKLQDHIKLIPDYLRPRPPTVRILFVCEGLNFDEPGGFSFKILLDTLRTQPPPYVRFKVTLAAWGFDQSTLVKDSAPGDYDPTYSNYRFSSTDPDTGHLILDDHDEVWLFGFAPGGANAVPSADLDAYVDGSGNPLIPTEADLAAIAGWMDAKRGGVLAMGDHASLGAVLCKRIPRVWTMRRWTQEDGAPPQFGFERIDTNRPMDDTQNPAVTSPPSQIPFEAQSDEVPQPIGVRHYFRFGSGGLKAYPHPVLCGGKKLGVINVLPDHPHEGWIRETSEITLDNPLSFDGGAWTGDEYPTPGVGARPKPAVIAWGQTTAHPPYDHDKGNEQDLRFGIIGAYDGHSASVGRVVVDATWHHWMSINASGTYAEDQTGGIGLMEQGGTNWAKVQTYWRNVAVWLAPPGRQRAMANYTLYSATWSVWTHEEWHLDVIAELLGRQVSEVLTRQVSECLLYSWTMPLPLEELVPKRSDWPCLTCPPWDWVHAVILGEMMQESLRIKAEQLAVLRARHLDKSLHASHLERLEVTREKRLEGARERAVQRVAETLRAADLQRTSAADALTAALRGGGKDACG